MNLSKDVKTTLISIALTSTAETDYSDQIDMSGYDGVWFQAIVATTAASTGTATFAAVGTNTSTAASTDYSSITGASVTITPTTSVISKFCSLDMPKPRYRYLKTKSVRTAKCAFGGILAHQYSPATAPVTQSSSTLKGTATLVVYQTT